MSGSGLHDVPQDGSASPSGAYHIAAARVAPRAARWRYATFGVLLAVGAPAGALLIRLALGNTFAEEVRFNLFFYLYQLLGTSVAFGIAGYIAGRRTDFLQRERNRFFVLAEHDELTHLLNSRAFWDRYRRSIDKARKSHEPLSLLLIDLDRLKEVNDQEGHGFGNAVLQHVGRAIIRSKRAEDYAARWGGDEFVILMPGAPEQAATRVAENVLTNVSQTAVAAEGKSRRITVTIGVATASRSDSAEKLFERADQALYDAKRAGRNQYKVEGQS